MLIPEFSELGIESRPVIWDVTDAGWQEFDAIVIRSCWDYHKRLQDFLQWLGEMEKLGISMFNSPSLVRWNCDKSYLKDLAEQGVPIAPTVWLTREAPRQLSTILRKQGWNRAVIKPTVSATAYKTWLVSSDVSEADQEKLSALLKMHGSVLVQKFMPEIATAGEWSLIFFDKQFSHALLKRPKQGDFRVQEEFGGDVRQQDPPDELIKQASEILSIVQSDCLYARVDGLLQDEQFILMELELIEPALYLKAHPMAAQRLVRALLSRLDRHS